jgi:hypothetical protein
MKRMPGFSLIEVVLSSVLVATTVGGLFAVNAMATRLTGVSQDRLIATQLSREGIEVVRYARNRSVLGDIDCGSPNPCDDWLSRLPIAEGGSLKVIQETPQGFVLRDPQTDAPCLQGEKIVFGSKVFCRRLYLFPIKLSQSTATDTSHALRVISQVVWLGHGREEFMVPNLATPLCSQNDATQWCSDQVTLLTDWRGQP